MKLLPKKKKDEFHRVQVKQFAFSSRGNCCGSVHDCSIVKCSINLFSYFTSCSHLAPPVVRCPHQLSLASKSVVTSNVRLWHNSTVTPNFFLLNFTSLHLKALPSSLELSAKPPSPHSEVLLRTLTGCL